MAQEAGDTPGASKAQKMEGADGVANTGAVVGDGAANVGGTNNSSAAELSQDDEYVKMIIRHETEEKFNKIDERIGKLVHDGLKDTIATVKMNEAALDEFDVMIRDHAKRLEKHKTQISKLEE